MARSRNIKPGFFKNEDLAECTLAARLCFAGLWTLADREGRLEDRPKRIKGELFPFDSIEVDPLLVELERWKFIRRYIVKGERFIQIVNFVKHQVPHGTEKDGTIPDENGFLTVHERGRNGYATGNVRLDDGSSTVKPTTSAQPDNSALTVKEGMSEGGQNPLIPDSRFLIPELRNTSSSAAEAPTCPHLDLIALYGKHLPELPQPRPELWKGKNAEAMRARWRWTLTATKETGERYATTEAEALAFFDLFFGHVVKSDFLSGRNGKWTGCDLGWLMKADNFAKVVQGNYDNKTEAAPARREYA